MNAITLQQRRTLAKCEAVIERGLATFVEVGKALREIRDAKLYAEAHATFAEYCRERWGFEASRARQLIAAAKVTENVESVTNVAPANEAVARELNRVPEEQQAEVWQEVVERTDGTPTAADVREVAQAASFTCPNCGAHEADEEGDCTACWEPAAEPEPESIYADILDLVQGLDDAIAEWKRDNQGQSLVPVCDRLEDMLTKYRK